MSKEIDFAIFCLESYKNYKSMTGKQVWTLFEKYGVIDYIKEFYDVLHTTGSQFINHDIEEYLNVRDAIEK